MSRTTTTLLAGLRFGEGPRWRDGRLWFSDMHDHQVLTVDEQGRSEMVVEVPGRPSGLGWRPDGTLLVVSMTDRKLMEQAAGGLREVAEGLITPDILAREDEIEAEEELAEVMEASSTGL